MLKCKENSRCATGLRHSEDFLSLHVRLKIGDGHITGTSTCSTHYEQSSLFWIVDHPGGPKEGDPLHVELIGCHEVVRHLPRVAGAGSKHHRLA